MNQSSRDHTLLDIRPSPGPGRGAVSCQSSRDKRRKRSLPGSTVRKEGRAISVVRTEDRGAVRIVTIDRPEARNAIGAATAAELDEAITALAGDDRVAVVSFRTGKQVRRIKVGDHPQRMRPGVIRRAYVG